MEEERASSGENEDEDVQMERADGEGGRHERPRGSSRDEGVGAAAQSEEVAEDEEEDEELPLLDDDDEGDDDDGEHSPGRGRAGGLALPRGRSFMDALRDEKSSAMAVCSIVRLLRCRETASHLADTSMQRYPLHGRSAELQRRLQAWSEAGGVISGRGKGARSKRASAFVSSRVVMQPCALEPSPRSTIAAAFSRCGSLLASTHGDHTVKLTDFRTGVCVRSLHGHMRTPWVVRFNPVRSNILVSGSLDREVRLWDSFTGECLQAFQFSRPIASISFHASGDIMAIATGHKLYMCQCNDSGDSGDGDVDMDCGAGGATPPVMVLRTDRSLRAVQFHPTGAPYLLTAELHQIISQRELIEHLPLPLAQDSHMDVRRDAGIGPHVLASVHANGGRSGRNGGGGGGGVAESSFRRASADAVQQHLQHLQQNLRVTTNVDGRGAEFSRGRLNHGHAAAVGASAYSTAAAEAAAAAATTITTTTAAEVTLRGAGAETSNPASSSQRYPRHHHHLFPRQYDHGRRPPHSHIQQQHEYQEAMRAAAAGHATADAGHAGTVTSAVAHAHSSADMSSPTSQQHQGHESGAHFTEHGGHQDDSATTAAVAAMAAAAAAAAFTGASEQPCCVKLRLWPFEPSRSGWLLGSTKPLLTLQNVVLCSEMGAHFSPCGRFLVVAVVCHTPVEATSVLEDCMDEWEGGGSDFASSGQISYELRVLSMERASFGRVLAAKNLAAAHCLTSIQVSPTSKHVLVAYGRRHMALLESLVADRTSITPMHTIVEMYSLPNLELVDTIASAEDEVNVATFHPIPGEGFAYGTKEGRLQRIRRL